MNPNDLPKARTKNSTTVRANEDQPPLWLKAGLNTLDSLFPHTTAGLLQRLFTTPPRPALRPDEAQVLAHATRWQCSIRGMQTNGYDWGDRNGPAVLLIHGWGGHAGHMTGLVAPLLRAGYRVQAVDAPGHGSSPHGRSTILHFYEAIEAMARHAGGEVHGIVAHSLGAAAATYALARGLPVRRAVFIGPFTSFEALWNSVQQRTGASTDLIRRMIGRLESDNFIGFDELDPIGNAEQMRTPLLVVHDADDDKVPPQQGQLLAKRWPGAQLRLTAGLGHLKILKDPLTLSNTVQFLQR